MNGCETSVPPTGTFTPVFACTRTIHGPIGPIAYDCIKVIVVRSGSAILFSEFGQKPVNVGDAVLLASNTLCGSEPEGHITCTTVYLDTDYVIDQVRWQYVDLLHDRLDAEEFAKSLYTESAQILRLGEDRAGMLMPWLDELVALSIDGRFARNFYRMQALWFSIAHVIAPYITVSPARVSPSQREHIRPTLPRTRQFTPLRTEARQAAELLRDAPAEPWTLEGLARSVHLSTSQLVRVFTDAYGKTPSTFLAMVRAEQLARLLRETDYPVTAAMRQVGWRSRGHAARLFRQYVGVTPGAYRRLSVGMADTSAPLNDRRGYRGEA